MRSEKEILKEINSYKLAINEIEAINFLDKKNKIEKNKTLNEYKNNIQVLEWVINSSNFLPF